MRAGSGWFARPADERLRAGLAGTSAEGRIKMHPQDLMLSDRFSTIVLLGVVGLAVISLLVFVMVVLA